MRNALLLDGDMIAYRNAFACQTTYTWSDEVTSISTDLPAARRNVVIQIEALKKSLKADEVVIALSDPEANWRKEIYPGYKANRKEKRKPELLSAMRDLLRETYKTWERPTLEADDVLGILSTANIASLQGYRKIIVSDDKDFLTVPGWLCRKGKLVLVDEDAADRHHLHQTLTGDPVDGYPGCRGIGPKRAEKILDAQPDGPIDPEITHVQWMWEQVVAAYEAAGSDEETALTMSRVARICRASDYDFTERKVKLWHPVRSS